MAQRLSLLADGARVRACAAKAALKRERKENDKEREREGKDTGDDDDDDDEEDAKGAFKKCARARPVSLSPSRCLSGRSACAARGGLCIAACGLALLSGALLSGRRAHRATAWCDGALRVCACGADRPRLWAIGTSSRSRRSLSK